MALSARRSSAPTTRRGPSTIDFATGLSGTITLTSGPLTIANNDVTMKQGQETVFSASPATTPAGCSEVDQVQVTISGLTITGGNVGCNTSGGGILGDAPEPDDRHQHDLR